MDIEAGLLWPASFVDVRCPESVEFLTDIYYICGIMMENSTIRNRELHSEPFCDAYVECIFEQCSFLDIPIDKTVFEKCVFKDCDFSNSKFLCHFEDVRFIACKMIGADFSLIGKYSSNVKFLDCNLSFAYFAESKLKGSIFSNCLMHECDFSGADLSNSTFGNCDLSLAVFSNSNLVNADMESSFNYRISPVDNRVKGLTVSESGIRGLLSGFGIVIK